MFRFTIRDVLWLTVVVAMGVGWLTEHRRAVQAEQGQDKLATYRAALVEMGKFVRDKTGEPVRIRVLEDVLDQYPLDPLTFPSLQVARISRSCPRWHPGVAATYDEEMRYRLRTLMTLLVVLPP